jgi:hypothetical protein
MRTRRHLSSCLRMIAAELDERGLALSANIVRDAAAFIASCDTRPEGGDSTKIEAPFTGGAVVSEASETPELRPGSSSPSTEVMG